MSPGGKKAAPPEAEVSPKQCVLKGHRLKIRRFRRLRRLVKGLRKKSRPPGRSRTELKEKKVIEPQVDSLSSAGEKPLKNGMCPYFNVSLFYVPILWSLFYGMCPYFPILNGMCPYFN